MNQEPPTGRQSPTATLGRPTNGLESVAGITLAFVCLLGVTPLVREGVIALAYSLTSPESSFTTFQASAASYEIPIGLAASGLSIASMLLVCALLMRVVHRARLGELSSVQGRLRWRHIAVYTVVAVVTIIGGSLMVGVIRGTPLTLTPQSGAWGFLLAIALVTPWQSAAEEYVFRGYLLYAVRGLVPNPWVGALLGSMGFALLHGNQNLALFLNRLAFGLLASALVILTGGLEASIAAHVCNNVGAYTMATLTSSVAQLRSTQALTWTDSLIDTGIFVAFALASLAIARFLPRTESTAVTSS